MPIISIAVRLWRWRSADLEAPQRRARSRPWARALLLGAVLSVSGTPAAYATLQQGGAAYKAGRYEEAFKHFLAEARKGTPVAQYLVASMYAEGRGALKSATLAASWYQLAAAQGDAESQYALALLHLEGEGVAKNPAKAAELLQQAADAGLESAMNTLATLYLEGRGVPEDAQRAFVLFERAAQAGHVSARYNLGRAYLYGEGTAQDAAAARHWLEIAALDQHPGAQLQMGTALAEGRFGLIDEALAAAWMQLAAEHGLQLAKTNLDTLDKHLTPPKRAKVSEELERLRARLRTRAQRGDYSPTSPDSSTAPKTE